MNWEEVLLIHLPDIQLLGITFQDLLRYKWPTNDDTTAGPLTYGAYVLVGCSFTASGISANSTLIESRELFKNLIGFMLVEAVSPQLDLLVGCFTEYGYCQLSYWPAYLREKKVSCFFSLHLLTA